MDYRTFAEECMEALKPRQDKFLNEYDIGRYERWFYNDATGLLTFSTGNEEINFRYFDLGSFSEKSKTWKWSWDNAHTPDSIKYQAAFIRDFGREMNYPKLVEGCFETDEYDAWEFATIALHLTGGIGIYRPVNDNQLKIFLVVTEFIDNETARKIKDKYVNCAAHKSQRVAFVCKHLIGGAIVGFHEAFDTYEGMELGEDDDFQAWCDDCEATRAAEGEWNDKSMIFADIKLVCEKCYFEIKERNLGHALL